VPLLGLRVRDLGLPLFTVVLGLLDGFNPCAMWVLLFVLSLLVNLRDRRKMAVIGATFVLVSGVVYFAFMAAWLNLFLLVGVSRSTQVVLAVIAGVIGALNVKDAVAIGDSLSLTIPASARPGLYARVRAIVTAESLASALAGVIVLAVLVNVIELLCTAGLPALYTRILTLHELPASILCLPRAPQHGVRARRWRRARAGGRDVESLQAPGARRTLAEARERPRHARAGGCPDHSTDLARWLRPRRRELIPC
jgi:hypothetical protein